MLILFDAAPSIHTSIQTDQQPRRYKMVNHAIFPLAIAMMSGLASVVDFHYRFCKPTAPPSPLEAIALTMCNNQTNM